LIVGNDAHSTEGGALQPIPRVSVITAAYNAAAHVAETIESVLAQTYQDFDYIVVDDGSSDETAEIVSRYAPRVTMIRQENAGAGAARNRGIELAGGDYVAIVDADDVWAPDKLERQVAALDQHLTAGVCYTNAMSVTTDESTLEAVMVPPHGSLTCRMAMTGRHPIVTSSVLFRRRFLEDRPYRTDLRVAEDYHVNLKVLWRCGERSVFIDDPLVRYRVVETSLLRQIDAWGRGRLTLKAVEAFIDDMRVEKPVPAEVQRQALAYCHFMWAWYCIDGRVRYRFAAGELLKALRGNPRLAWLVSRQEVKLVRNAVRSGIGR
jgi:Glycosyltransferases, probably involved in cell wall biogenesis